jgi:pimeloyl-ACP methyl ester carboxylesterase
MRTLSILFCLLPVLAINLYGQPGKSTIEFGSCPIKTGQGVISKCGYLVAPEDRNHPGKSKVKLPFIFVRRADQSPTRNITLFCTGGPGYSTIANIDSIGPNSDWLSFGGFIAFDQRGSKRSIPNLECTAVNEAIRRSYREGLNKDSLVLLAVSQCQAGFAAKGINLSAYTTIESAADINDLRVALGLDSLNLLGISYSGGLMLTVARHYPEAVRCLILGSPLPGFVNYEEHALFNINEALNKVFDYYESDSAGVNRYGDLRNRFRDYFTNITGRYFTMNYWDKTAKDSIRIRYGKDELMDAILNGMTANGLRYLPQVMDDIIRGKHAVFVSQVVDGYFSEKQTLSHGMRYSLYCTEQIAYSDTALLRRQAQLLPWLAGFAFNNVDHALCACWKTRPESPVAKTPVYSAVPALITAGDIDPWCSPFYNRLIRRTMPNAQLLTFKKRGHTPGYGVKGTNYLKMFITDPYRKLTETAEGVVIE